MNTIRIHAYVSGRVQGVGFRFFTRKTAAEHGLSGWVRNLSDGRVELEAQGPPKDISAFRQAVRQGPDHFAYVDDYQEEEVPAKEGDKEFVIRH